MNSQKDSPGLKFHENNDLSPKDIRDIIILEEDEDEEEKENFQTCKNSMIQINNEDFLHKSGFFFNNSLKLRKTARFYGIDNKSHSR